MKWRAWAASVRESPSGRSGDDRTNLTPLRLRTASPHARLEMASIRHRIARCSKTPGEIAKPSESIFFFPHGPRAGHIPSHHQNKPLMRKFACVLHALLIRYKRKGPASPKSCPLTGFRSQAALSPFFDNPLDSSQQPEPRHIIFGAAGAKASPLIGGDALPHRCVTRLRRFPATHCNHIDLHPRPKM